MIWVIVIVVLFRWVGTLNSERMQENLPRIDSLARMVRIGGVGTVISGLVALAGYVYCSANLAYWTTAGSPPDVAYWATWTEALGWSLLGIVLL